MSIYVEFDNFTYYNDDRKVIYMKRRISFILLLISCSLCLSFMSSTYSRYVAGTTGNIDILFAKWQILVDNTEIINQNSSSISFTPIIETNENVRDNTIAPTSKGYFDIDINPENVDVSFNYQIDLEIDNEDIPDLMITKYAILDNNYQEGDVIEYTTLSNNTITNDMLFDNTSQNFSFNPFTVRIYFEWFEGENELMDNDDDTLIGNEAAEDDVTFTINANISFEQIIDSLQNNENNEEIDISETP